MTKKLSNTMKLPRIMVVTLFIIFAMAISQDINVYAVDGGSITVGEKKGPVESQGEDVVYTFVPEETATYKFHLIGSINRLSVVDENGNSVGYSWWPYDEQFTEGLLDKGKTYTITLPEGYGVLTVNKTATVKGIAFEPVKTEYTEGEITSETIFFNDTC